MMLTGPEKYFGLPEDWFPKEVFSPNIPEDRPDECAYLVDFAGRLFDGEYEAVQTWRSALCEVFFGRLFREVDPKLQQGNTQVGVNTYRFSKESWSSYAGMYAKALKAHPEQSAFASEPEYLLFYHCCGAAYAMYVPGIVLLPFAVNRDRTLAKSFFLHQRKDPEPSVFQYFDNNASQVTYFLRFLSNIRMTCLINSVDSYDERKIVRQLEYFADELCRRYQVPDDYMLEPRSGLHTVEQALAYDFVAMLLSENRSFPHRELLEKELFEKQALCFFGSIEQMYPAQQFEDNSAYGRYRFNYEGKKLTPLPVYCFLDEDENNPLYVVPPAAKTLYEAFAEKSFVLNSWSADVSLDHQRIDVTFYFRIEGSGITFQSFTSYEVKSLFISRELPYICLWPFVNASDWNRYYIGVMPSAVTGNALREPYDNIEACKELTKLSPEQISVTVPACTEHNSISTFGVKKESFEILCTETLPDLIMLSFGKIKLGCWQIVKDGIKTAPHSDTESTGVLGLDFATTASVMKLYYGNTSQEIEGPGRYLQDIFNPNYGSPMEEERWHEIHNYTMFGSYYSSLSKVYTFGQNNDAVRNYDKIVQVENLVTGRAVMVTPQYLEYSIDPNMSFEGSTIYSNLKWPESAENEFVATEKDRARDNFILNMLVLGALSARMHGYNNLDIRLSSPSMNKMQEKMRASVEKIRGELEKISGYRGFEFKLFSEAEANAAFLIKGYSTSASAYGVLNGKNGFMIVDIGGGTTDIVVCQYEKDNIPFSEKKRAECSFKFAGMELIDIPLLMTDKVNEMWEPATDVDIRKVLANLRYQYTVDTRTRLKEDVSRAVSTIGFVLDNARYKNEHLKNVTEKARLNIQLKFLALFWLLGVYTARLQNAGRIKLLNDRNFNVCLTGCASEGIQGFCLLDDRDFYDKCVGAMQMGFASADTLNSATPRFFIDDPSIQGNTTAATRKEAVATGLVLLEPSKDLPDTSSIAQLAAVESKKHEEEEPENKVTFDSENVMRQFKALLRVLKQFQNKSCEYNELTDRDREIFAACLKGKDGKYSTPDFLLSKIGETPITDEFIAMYLLEIGLDLRTSVTKDSHEKIITGSVESQVEVPVRLTDKYVDKPQKYPIHVKFTADYEIDVPRRFAMMLNGEVKTANKDDIDDLEKAYVKRLKVEFTRAIKEYPNGISFEKLTSISGDESIRNAVLKAMTNTKFENAGFLIKELKCEIAEMDPSFEHVFQLHRRGYLAGSLEFVYRKKKASCVLQEDLTVSLRMQSRMRFSGVYENATGNPQMLSDGRGSLRNTIQPDLTITYEVRYRICDKDFFFTYRGIDMQDRKQMAEYTRDYQNALAEAVDASIKKEWKNGIDYRLFRFERQAGTQSVYLDTSFVTAKRIRKALASYESEGTFRLESITVYEAVEVSEEIPKQLQHYENVKLIQEAKKIAATNHSIPGLTDAINLLLPKESDPFVGQAISELREQYKELVQFKKIYQAAVELKKNGKLKDLKSARQQFQMLADHDFMNAAEQVAVIDNIIAEIERKKKRRKRIRKIILIILIILAVLYGINAMRGGGFAGSVDPAAESSVVHETTSVFGLNEIQSTPFSTIPSDAE